jgi:RNA polymerase sigma-70 factor (ECF subfamily)
VTFFLTAFQDLAGGSAPSDAALMEQLVRHEPGALDQLYDRYARVVFSLVVRISQQAALAEEIVQDVFLQLWRNAHRYQAGRGPLEPWLLTMARNRALDHLRMKREKQRRREDALDAIEPRDFRAPSPEAAVDQNRRAERVRTVMRALPDVQRRAIELAFFEGMTHSEIAASMSEPLGTVKSWIRNGLGRLREALEEGS